MKAGGIRARESYSIWETPLSVLYILDDCSVSLRTRICEVQGGFMRHGQERETGDQRGAYELSRITTNQLKKYSERGRELHEHLSICNLFERGVPGEAGRKGEKNNEDSHQSG